MIGGGVTPEGTNIQRFLPRTIDEDQWQSANRAHVLAVDANTAARKSPSGHSSRKEGEKPRVNIIGPIYGTFNTPSDLAEIRRLVEGIGAEINMVFPLGSHLADVAKLVDADVNICMYREFGRMLCEALERPYLQAPIGLHSTTKFLRKLGEILGARSRTVHRAREAHDHQAAVGSVALGHAGFLRHGQLRHRRQRNLRARRQQFLETEMGLPCTFAFARRAGVKPDNEAVRSGHPRKAAARSCSVASTSACISPKVAPARRTSRPRSLAPSSGGTPARRSWAMPAPPISSRKFATRCSMRCSRFCRSAPNSTRSTRRQPACTERDAVGRRCASTVLDEMLDAATGYRPNFRRQAPARPCRARGAPGRRGTCHGIPRIDIRTLNSKEDRPHDRSSIGLRVCLPAAP